MANKEYIHAETAIVFRPVSVGGGGKNLELTALANASGVYSEVVDLGANARAGVYEWRGKVTMDGDGVLGNSVELYIATSDGTLVDGKLSNTAGDVFSTADTRRNLQYLGSLMVDDITTNSTFVSSGLVNIYARYIYFVVWNNAGVALSSIDTDNKFTLTPVPAELQ